MTVVVGGPQFVPGGMGCQWARYGYNFTATGDTTDITIWGLDNKNDRQDRRSARYIGVDDVSVKPVPYIYWIVWKALHFTVGRLLRGRIPDWTPWRGGGR